MSPSQASGSKTAPRDEGVQPQRRPSSSKLNPSMASDTAFRVVARRLLGDLAKHHEATCKGDAGALHRMRMALTRLRAALSFFSPTAADPKRAQIKRELKWLNAHLGAARDMDVMVERLKETTKQRPQANQDAIHDHRTVATKRAETHRRLTRALRSARYRKLIESTSRLVENDPENAETGKPAIKARTSPLASYSANKLMRWQEKLLRKSRKLRDMDTKKRHRLRIANKKLFYSTEFLVELFPAQKSRQQARLKYLRKAQKSLGQLNDDANTQSLAATLQRDGAQAHLQLHGPKHEKRLIKKAAKAYQKLAELEPLRA
jgi:CHAD domain-containing protein